MNKKIKKMINNPSLFFKDMWRKRVLRIQTTAPKKYICKQSYNIIIVGNETTTNISECIASIKAQRVNPHVNLNLILLDLGMPMSQLSIAQSSDIRIVDTQTLSSDNLFFELTGKYTVFIWADDCIDVNFILKTDQLISINKTKHFGVIYSRPLKGTTYNNIAREYHPLRVLHKKIASVGSSPAQLIAETIYGCVISTAHLKLAIQDTNGYQWLDFDGLETLLNVTSLLDNKKIIGFSKLSNYISYENTLTHPFKGTDWANKELFECKFSNIINVAGKIISTNKKWDPFARKTLLYFILKYINKGLVNQSLLDICGDKEKNIFVDEIKRAINLIGLGSINSFNFTNSALIKSGCAKWIDEYSFNKHIEVIQYDNDKDMGLLRYYISEPKCEKFIINDIDTLPFVDKTIEHKLFSYPFSYERRIWLPLNTDDPSSHLTVCIDNKESNIIGLDKKRSINLKTITVKNFYLQNHPHFKCDPAYENVWIFMDRDNQADDNAEHLYRYILNNRPDIDAYFVLNRDSHDWARLSADGFKMLAFGSSEHESALESCSRVISSHAAQFATDYFKDKRMLSKKFVFLQHGVIHNDQSSLFKPDWKRFDLFLTSAYGEYESIGGELSTYKFTSKEVKLTGLPRHDALINSTIKREKMLLVMPTWRPALLGKVINGTERELLPDFINSQYAQAWMGIINNDKFREQARIAGYKIVFFPHANIQPYLNQFNVPDDVEILDHAAGSIQELFLKASMMITDYSSVAFEMAYLYKPVCYYQFDEDDFFTKGHYNKGYFDYREHGFGPVYNHEHDVIEYAIKNIENDCIPSPEYIHKVDNFFPYRDGRCCERVLTEIENLDHPTQSSYVTDAVSAANKACQYGLWHLAVSKYNLVFKNPEVIAAMNDADLNLAATGYIDALQALGAFNKASDIIRQYSHLNSDLLKRAIIKGNLYSDILQNKFTSFSEAGLASYSKIDYFFFLTMFSSTYKNSIDSNHTVLVIDDEAELFLQLCSSEPLSALSIYIKNKEKIAFEFFDSEFIEFVLLYFAKQYDEIVTKYRCSMSRTKGHIINKLIYLRALRELQKWKLMQKTIGTDAILQGRSGIFEFASNHFFVTNYERFAIHQIEDFDYVTGAINSDNIKLSESIVKYYLLIEKNVAKASKLIDLHINEIDIKLISIYIKKLTEAKQTEKAYHLLKEINKNIMPTELQYFYGHLALIYRDYNIAEQCFYHVALDKLPAIDKELNTLLQSIRLLKNGTQEHASLH